MRAVLFAALLTAPASGVAVPGEGEVVVVAVGDIRVGGPIGEIVEKFGGDFPVAGVKKSLQGDFLLGNLECAVTERGRPQEKTWTFRAAPGDLALLKTAGFNWLGLANNHVMDFGRVGLVDTLSALADEGFAFTGAGLDDGAARRPLFFNKNGLTIGLLAFTTTTPTSMWARPDRAGVSYADFKRVPAWVAAAKKECDILLVFFHGGTELSPEPNQVQRDFARLAADAGADVVIGHHPHVVQPVAVRGKTLILYSIGNFLFVSPTRGTERSVIARLRLAKSGVRAEFIPIDINWGRLRPADAVQSEAILAALDAEGAFRSHPERLSFLNSQ